MISFGKSDLRQALVCGKCGKCGKGQAYTL